MADFLSAALTIVVAAVVAAAVPAVVAMMLGEQNSLILILAARVEETGQPALTDHDFFPFYLFHFNNYYAIQQVSNSSFICKKRGGRRHTTRMFRF